MDFPPAIPAWKIAPALAFGNCAAFEDLHYLEVGQKDGARLLPGGGRLNGDTEGFHLALALFTETDNRMPVSREEIFRPIASVITARGYEVAFSLANATDLGVCAGTCTGALKYASRFKPYVQSGIVLANDPALVADYHVPVGGRKAFSYGFCEHDQYPPRVLYDS